MPASVAEIRKAQARRERAAPSRTSLLISKSSNPAALATPIHVRLLQARKINSDVALKIELKSAE
jgi:hypothetical protein